MASTPKLTERETQVLRWTAEGKTSWEVANILGMSERTVNFHINNIVKKLKVSNKISAVAYGVKHGLI